MINHATPIDRPLLIHLKGHDGPAERIPSLAILAELARPELEWHALELA